MLTLFDFLRRFKDNPVECENCGFPADFVNEGVVYSRKKPGFPAQIILLFECSNCMTSMMAVFIIEKIDLSFLSRIGSDYVIRDGLRSEFWNT